MNFCDVILAAWRRQIFSLKDCSINELSPVLSHFLFVNNSKILTNEFWVDGYDFDQLVPKTKDLSAYDIDIINQLIGELVRIKSSWSSDC